MVSVSASYAQPTSAAPVVVARPRRTDAIGNALRQAFRSPRGMPDQWSGALRRLDQLD